MSHRSAGPRDRRRADARRRLALESLEPRTVMHAADGGMSSIYLSAATGLGPLADAQVSPAGGLPNTLADALAQLENHSELLGLQPADLAASQLTSGYQDDGGLTHFYLQQTLNGLKIENARLNFSLSADGHWLALGGNYVANLAAQSAAVEPALDAASAVRSAAEQIGLGKVTAEVTQAGGGLARQAELASAASLDPIPTNLSYFLTNTGLHLGWELVLRTPDGNHWYHLGVDAADGRVIFQSDWIDDLATYYVYPAPGDNPTDIARTYVVNPATSASPFGWQDTNGVNGAEFTDTRGNNVYAQEDADANDTGGLRPDGGTQLNFYAPIDLTQSPANYTAGSTTNLFYWNNYLHDLHAAYGFTEAAGNFQQTNYTGQGVGADQVYADSQDGFTVNNANFGTPPDGQSPRMQQFVFTFTAPNRDSDLDNGIITHEYGHGITNRLTGGPANVDALNSLQSGGMGEGWGDWWALMLSQRTTDALKDAYPLGTYVLGEASTGDGLRRNPYSYDLTIDPITFADFAASTEVHNAGEIWASTLWDMNWNLIGKYGFDADLTTGYTGSGAGAAGNKLALRLVMDALKLQPANPSFTQARDAILTADLNLTGGRNQREIWSAFARRNLGSGATTASATATTITTSSALPAQFANPGIITQSPTGRTTTAPSSLDLTFSEAMNPATFNVAADVVSFTGPGGVNLLPSITGFTFLNSNTTLRISFTPQSTQGDYNLTLGPDIRDVGGAQMEQDGDSTPGETIADRYTANFRYDGAALTVASTNPAAGSSVSGSFNSLQVTFSEAVAAGSVGTDDLQLSQGTVSGFAILSPTVVRYDVTGVSAGLLAVNLKTGAVTDAAGFPVDFFSAVYGVPNTFAELLGGTLTITDGPDGTSDDSLTITRSGANLRITDTAGGFVAGAGVTSIDFQTVEIPFANITGSIVVNTFAGNDQLTINLAGGDAIPSGGITFNGGTNTAAGDRLILTGGSQGTVTYTYTGANSGAVATSSFGTVNYTGAEALTNSGIQQSAVFTPPSGADTMFLEDDATSGNATSQLRSGGTFLTTVFAHPTTLLTINGGTSDAITLNTVDNFASSVMITAGSIAVARLSTSGTATLTANGSITESGSDAAVDLIADTASLNGAAGVSIADALEMTANTLSADGGSGGVNVSNSQALTVSGVNTNDGDIAITATGTVTVIDAVTNFGPGTVSITAANAIGGAYVVSSPALNYQDIATTGTRLGLADDEISSAIGIGFSFKFFDVAYTNAYLSSNGFLTFLSGQPNNSYTAAQFPSSVTPNGMIGGYWTDINPAVAPTGTAGGVFYQTLGSPGSRVFVAEYKALPNYGRTSSDFTFQIKLYETTNVIEVHYLHADNDGNANGSAGIENAAGTIGNSYFFGTGDIADNTAVRYTPPGPPDLILEGDVMSGGDVTLSAAGNILENSGSVTTTDTGAITYTASTASSNGGVTMGVDTQATALSGSPITITGAGSLTLESLTTAGPVYLTGGAIVSGSAAVNVTGYSVSLSAGAGAIGAAGNSLTLDATTLTTSSTGPQYLADSAKVRVYGLNAGAQTITLTGGVFETAANAAPLSPVIVAAGAVLSGTGTATAVTVQSGGGIAPGAGPGVLNAGATTIAAGGVLTAELNSNVEGTGYDQLNVTGAVNITGATLNPVLGFAAPVGSTFTLINNDGNDAVTGAFAGWAEGQIKIVNTGAIFGRYSISYVGGTGNDVVLTRAADILRVNTVTPTATGARIALSKPVVVAGKLNLFDHVDLGPADLQLVGATVGPVVGSLIPEPGNAAFTFVSYSGALAPDTYTLTLRSATDAFLSTFGELLDGDDNGTPGGSFSYTFAVTAPAAGAVQLSLPSFARGPQQPVNLPANATTGLPIRMTSSVTVTQAQFELRYDPALLNITGVTLPATVPVGSSAALTVLAADRVRITLNFATPLLTGTQTIAFLTADVPTGAASRYGERNLLDISAGQVFSGAVSLPVIDVDGLQVNAYLGDVGDNGNYDSFDVQQVSRMALRLDTGFRFHPLLAPLIIGNFSTDSGIDSFDVQRVSSLALRLAIAEAPPLPSTAVTTTSTGRIVAEDPPKADAVTPAAEAPAAAASVARSDLNIDGVVDPQDILWAIYYYNRSQSGDTTLVGETKADINQDGEVAPDDILLAITDYQSSNPSTGASITAAEGESIAAGEEASDALELLALDQLTSRKKK